MKRKLVLEASKYAPPSTVTRTTTGLEVELDLRRLFRNLHTDIHGRPQQSRKNPYYDIYSDLLDPGTDYLVFTDGIAVSDHRESKSQELGRGFARGYLMQHHSYTWFAQISEMIKRPHRGWTAARPAAGGDMPDLLGVSGVVTALIEAKGTHKALNANSKALGRWRAQVTNVDLLRHGASVPATSLKTWLIATRWVGSAQKRTLPKMFCEDPEPTSPLSPDHAHELATVVSHHHVARSLVRVGHSAVAQRIFQPDGERVRVATWTCDADGIGGERFVGRIVTGSAAVDPLAGAYGMWWWWEHFGPMPPPMRILRNFFRDPKVASQLEAIWHQEVTELLESAWFEGCAISTAKAAVRGELPRALNAVDVAEGGLGADGLLVVPLSYMARSEEDAEI